MKILQALHKFFHTHFYHDGKRHYKFSIGGDKGKILHQPYKAYNALHVLEHAHKLYTEIYQDNVTWAKIEIDEEYHK